MENQSTGAGAGRASENYIASLKMAIDQAFPELTPDQHTELYNRCITLFNDYGKKQGLGRPGGGATSEVA